MSITLAEIRSQLTKLGFLGPGITVSDNESLIDSGAIDSLRLIEFVSHVEREYGITVDPVDLVPENFDSIEGMSRYLSSRTVAGQDVGAADDAEPRRPPHVQAIGSR